MPIAFLHRLTGPERTRRANRQLGTVLAFVAGAINAGGYLAVHRYTSHMTGIVSGMADDIALGQGALAGAGLAMLVSFAAGGVTTSILVNWARQRRLHSEFALPLVLEAVLLLVFGLVGANLGRFADLLVPSAVLLLCFVMGLQNATVTKVSKAEIRTTHMTGVITDLSIEVGRLLYWNRTAAPGDARFVKADRDRLGIHATILGFFFAGGVSGAFAFQTVGFAATVPLAALLFAMALPPLTRDLRTAAKAW